MYLRTGILLATIGIAGAVAEKPNMTSEAVTLPYNNLHSNISSTRSTLTQNEREITASEEYPVSGVDDTENSSEESRDNSTEQDSTASTTLKSENSKLLYSYVVTAKPGGEKQPKAEAQDDESEELKEEVENDNEDFQEDADDDKEDFEEDDRDDDSHLEEEEADQSHLQEEEEETEEDYPKSANVRKTDGEDEYEDEEHPALFGNDIQELENYSEEPEHYENESDDEDYPQAEEYESDEETTVPNGPRRPVVSSWMNEPPRREKKPMFEFTTLEPVDMRPVSYSSVVYDPDGKNTKTELSGSFYKKPLKSTPNSEVFGNDKGTASKDTMIVSVTEAPAQERSIEAPLQEEEEEEYEEPEAVTSNIKFRIMEDRLVPKRVIEPGLPRHKIEWYYKPDKEEEEEESKQKDKIYQDRDVSYYEQTTNANLRSRGEESEELAEWNELETEAEDLIKPKEEEEWLEQKIREEMLREDDGEEVMNDYDDETPEHVPAKKDDRNQLYEYVVNDGVLRQGVSENNPRKYCKSTTTTTTTAAPTQEVASTTTLPSKEVKTERVNHDKIHYRRPQQIAFGTVARPDEVRTFKSTGTNDAVYNRIVSNIQSLFRRTTPRPISDYEQRFTPSRDNCLRAMPLRDSANYETFVQPSQTLHRDEDDEEEDEEEEEEDDAMPKRLPMKTYIVQKRIPLQVNQRTMKKPSGVKVAVYPLQGGAYREAKPVTYRNAVYLGPATSPNQLIRKVVYFRPNAPHTPAYSSTNQIVRIIHSPIRDSRGRSSNPRMLIIRKLH